MPLSKERVGEIAMMVLQDKLENNGSICLNPKEVKRDIINISKKLGITPQEGAEFAGIIFNTAYDKTMVELNSLKNKDED